ncbi:site-specific integrase [Tolypothrix sp. FACHB-123]|uniref:site-specific integrase n=1 Tax=Tolypothrix sp. FACHB-123 TaxID=2692868 RepID=UPI00168217C4|nr:site-specific integrase [Tolypothrix sp. FACHB-123]MBD2359276.1 site-specific integrase [Tolypothrix sp. FACHB-123]
MTLIPTDRARTYYELEMGRTLVHGIIKDSIFISADKLEDKTEAFWYIHLLPNDYKTGKIYKEYWGKIDNVVFKDGKKLYEYIDRWINKERECEQKCNHNKFFRGTQNYDALKSQDWSLRIRKIFETETGVPVTPKELRKIYITYLANQHVDDATLKGAAYAMHHSSRMQQSIYNSQTVLEKVQPIYEYNKRMYQDFFSNS